MDNKEILRVIADNQNLFDTLKLIILSKFDIITPLNGADDIVLGQILRASITGKQKVEEVFKEIAGYKTVRPEDIKRNQAR